VRGRGLKAWERDLERFLKKAEGRREKRKGGREKRLELGLRLKIPKPRVLGLKRGKKREREGGERVVLLPPAPVEYEEIRDTESGRVVLAGGSAYVYPADSSGIFGELAPLFEHPKTQEVFLRGGKVFATIGDRRYRVEVARGLDVERFVSNLVIATGAKLTWSHPQAEAEVHEAGVWRLYFKMPTISGEWEMTATRVVKIPKLPDIVEPLLAARLLTIAAAPSVVAIIGPVGSGKTTLLNSLLNEMVELWPYLRVSVVEQVMELVLPEGPNVARSRAGPEADVTTLVRQSTRYERPDVFVLGELRGEEIVSWIEVGRSGVPTLTTLHSPDILRAIRRMAALIRAAGVAVGEDREATARDVLEVVDCFVVCRKYVVFDRVERGVEEVYLSDPVKRQLVPVFHMGLHAPDEQFLRALPRKGAEAYVGGRPEELYGELKRRYGAGGERVEELEPLDLGELF